MKFLIWGLCLFANGIITTLLKNAGILLGAIPTIILFSATIWIAQMLCKKWEKHKEVKETKTNFQDRSSSQMAPIGRTAHESVAQIPCDDQICFCRKCGSRLVEGAVFCNKCGTRIIKE